MGTWSYIIMDNTQAWAFWARFYELINSSLEESEVGDIPDDKIKFVIEKLYDELVKLTVDFKSRLAYQVLGVFLMQYGAKMTSAVRELILIHSRWEDEEKQLFDERDRAERFHHLSNFREKIRDYENNVKTTVFYESPAGIVAELKRRKIITSEYPLITPPQRSPINYSIK